MNGAFVVDASATLPWCFPDEATSATESLLERLRSGETALVPAHWPVEVMNGLLMAVRRNRITPEKVTRFARNLSALPIQIELPCPPSSWKTLFTIAVEHGLTVYDAAYLEIAYRTGVPLATLDRELQSAAGALNVPLIEKR